MSSNPQPVEPHTCGVYHKKRDCFCTRPDGHEGYHVATFGPFNSRWAREIHRWPADTAGLNGERSECPDVE